MERFDPPLRRIVRCSILTPHPTPPSPGAERLIVDAATELAERGHDVRERRRGGVRQAGRGLCCSPLPPLPLVPQVTIYTAHHDPARAFKETVGGPFAVRVAGAWFPRTLAGGRAVALCAYVRCVLAALRLAWDSWR